MNALIKMRRSIVGDEEKTNLTEMIFTTRQDGTKRVLLMEQTLRKALINPHREIIERDLDNFIALVYDADRSVLRVTVRWMTRHYNSTGDTFTGYERHYNIPEGAVIGYLLYGKAKVLFEDKTKYPKIIFSESAYKRIREIVENGGKRELERFFSRNFKYPRTESIKVYDDPCINGFYFVEDDGRGGNGGIVPHGKKVKGRDGIEREVLYFSIHT